MRKIASITILSFLALILLNSCEAFKPKKVDARKVSPNAKDRVAKNIEEGRGIKLFGGKRGGEFEFANSNPMWRASLDTIDFMPLLSVDYGGGLIITDWFNDSTENSEAIKLTIKFLSNEIRADSIDIKIFKKICSSENTCKVSNSNTKLNEELKLTILKKAAIYQKNKSAKK